MRAAARTTTRRAGSALHGGRPSALHAWAASSVRAAGNWGIGSGLPCYQCRRRPRRKSGGRLISTRAAELGKAFLERLGEQGQAEQIGGSALVASACRLAAKIAPLLDTGIAPPEPGQGHEVGLLVLIERGDECR